VSLQYAHGAVHWLTTDAVGATHVVSGLAFQPKAMRFYCVGLQSASDATSDALNWNIGLGFATSTTDRRCVASHSQDNQAAAVCAVAHRADCVVCIVDGTPADNGRLDVSAIASDGFTLRVDVQNTQQSVTVFWEAWGGGDIIAAATGDITEPAGTGNQDYTVTGSFQPHVVMFAGSKQTTADAASAIDSGVCIGAATGPGNQWVFACNSDDGSATMDCDRYGQSTECLATHTEAGGNVNARATFVQFNADGFRLNWLARATTGRRSIYLAIRGGGWKAGTYTINAQVLNTTASVTGLPFVPLGCSQATHGLSETTAGSSSLFAVLGFGCFSSTASRRAMGAIDEDATGNSEIDTLIDYDSVIAFPNTTGAPPGVLKAIDVNTVTADGFQMIVDTAGGISVDIVGYLAFGSEVPLGPIGSGMVPP
jgi:hypothetical protein